METLSFAPFPMNYLSLSHPPSFTQSSPLNFETSSAKYDLHLHLNTLTSISHESASSIENINRARFLIFVFNNLQFIHVHSTPTCFHTFYFGTSVFLHVYLQHCSCVSLFAERISLRFPYSTNAQRTLIVPL